MHDLGQLYREVIHLRAMVMRLEVRLRHMTIIMGVHDEVMEVGDSPRRRDERYSPGGSGHGKAFEPDDKGGAWDAGSDARDAGQDH